jgi:hypothetical protein
MEEDTKSDAQLEAIETLLHRLLYILTVVSIALVVLCMVAVLWIF